MPPTLISQKVDDINIFLNIHKDIITKPLYGNGGEGIHRSKEGHLEGLDADKQYFEMPIMAQKYIPEISEGDRRIIFFDGDYVGSVARIPLKGSIKANFHAGGSAKKTGLVFRDQQIIEALARELKKMDLFFVGIDIIGNFLTEINVTSPTGIKQINKLNVENSFINYFKSNTEIHKGMKLIDTELGGHSEKIFNADLWVVSPGVPQDISCLLYTSPSPRD